MKTTKTTTAKVINKSNNELPKYSTSQSAGLDLRANISENIVIYAGERKLIPTGLHIQLPAGCEGQIRPRSGLALKHGITVLNAPGTIDMDFVGEIGVILINLGQEPFVVANGDRIAQMVVAKYEQVELIEVETLEDTERGSGGFGHTGTK